MLDEAYLAEANVVAAEILKERAWSKVLHADLLNPFFDCYADMLKIARYNDIIVQWSFMFECHGGM